MVKNLPVSAGDTGSISGLGRFHRQSPTAIESALESPQSDDY